MRLQRFDLNLLVFLDALLEEQNVTRAGERLNIGQSAASGALARLRDYFGDELLVQVGRRMMLTPFAQGLLQPARNTLLSAHAALAMKPGFDPATADRRFAIIASDYVLGTLLRDAVPRIAALAPGIKLDIRGPGTNVTERFERGDIDLLIIPKPYISAGPHAHEVLFEDRHVCVVWKGNAEIGDTLSFEQYMAAAHVSTHFGGMRHVMFEEWFLPRYGHQRRIDVTVDSFEAAATLVIGTQRIATVHGRQAQRQAQHLPLRVVAPPFDIPTLVEVMQWHAYLDNDPAHSWLRAQLRAVAQALPPLHSLPGQRPPVEHATPPAEQVQAG
jgi:DNA-binding transcriptional LysR family regulator